MSLRYSECDFPSMQKKVTPEKGELMIKFGLAFGTRGQK
jgi:hypothetical protein